MKKYILLLFLFIGLLFYSGCQMKTQNEFIDTNTIVNTSTTSLTSATTQEPFQTKTLQPSWTTVPSQLYLSFTPSITSTTNYRKQTNEAYWETSQVIGLTRTIQVEFTEEAGVATMNAKNLHCEKGQYRGMDWERYIETDNYVTKSDTWTLMSCILWYEFDPETTAPDFTKVINRNNTKVYTIQHEDLQLPRSCYLEVIHVDPNRELMYLTWDVNGDRDGFFETSYFGYGRSTYQLDLQTGDVNTLLEWPNGYKYLDLDFSPDYEIMAFTTSVQPNILNLMHSANGQIYQTVDLSKEITYMGAFTWTSDNKYLFYAAGHDGWETIQNGISIYRLNLQTMENVEIVKNDMRMMVPAGARQFPQSIAYNEKIELISIEYMNYFYDYALDSWEMVIETGEIIALPKENHW